MKSSLILASILVISKLLTGQFSVDSYLSAPFEKSEIIGLANQLEYMESESFKSPLFRELEIRLRSNDFNASPEDFRLRLGFMNPIEQRRNSSYNEVHAEYLQSKYSFEANLLIANRYKQLIRHYYLKSSIDIIDDEIKKLETVGAQLQTEKLSIKDWIDADKSMLRMQIKRNELVSSLEILENTLSSVHDLKDPIVWDNFDMISVDNITNISLSDSLHMSGKLDLAQNKLKLEEEAYMLNKAESWSNIGFLQAEYDIDRGKDVNDHLGFQIGINLPVFNVDRPKLQREKLDLIQQESEVKELLVKSVLDKVNLEKELIKNIRNYKLISNRLRLITGFAEDASYEELEDYLTLITYVGEIVTRQNNTYYDCLITYIDLLALSGKLSKSPAIIYISDDLRMIKEQ